MRKAILALTLGASMLVAGCSGAPLSTREKGTLLGGAVGAGGGAYCRFSGRCSRCRCGDWRRTGAGTGYVVGNHMQNEEYRHRYYGDY